MKFYVKTLGCKVNQSESEDIAGKLAEKGLTQTKILSSADLVIINTCTVTATADAKVRQFISKASKDNSKRVIVTGCAVANEHSGLQKFKNVEFVAQENKEDLPEKIASIGLKQVRQTMRSRPLLKIQDGCDNHCTYCIVPSVRGKSKSTSYSQVMDNAKLLVEQGFKEIVLTGVDIAAYGFNKKTLADVVNDILEIDSSFRLRLSSVEPQSIEDDLLSMFSQNDRICSHIHIPLQSGSNRLLKLMNRPYTAESFLATVNEFRKMRSDIAITTDIIVGFPSESENDFKSTLMIAKEAGFSKIHIFRYSKRPGTKAFNMSEAVSEEEKKTRAKELNSLAGSLAARSSKDLIGEKVQVLIEKKEGKYFKGLTSNYKVVYLTGRADKGPLFDAIIDSYKEDKLFGRLRCD